MAKTPHRANNYIYRNFIPQLRKHRDQVMYSGRIGAIGRTTSSRYRLVALCAFFSLLCFIVTSFFSPTLTAGFGFLVVALIAGGWPAATGVAELRRVRRIYSHSVIILLSGLCAVAMTLTIHTQQQRLYLLPAIAALGVVASFLIELSRGEGARGRLESVIACSTGVLASVSVAGWVGLANVYQSTHSPFPMMVAGTVVCVLTALVGARLVSAGPQEGPRRGAVTLGVTPVAFVGVISYVIAIMLTSMIG
ncbi:hypothetical protein ACN08X_01170 [Rothia sp. P6271]|uniref:hypothetical protein n=1 Tax=unclassified Rothia (in: high G+C Gram-positive bacteria) TaxID=2689056 RepID=UPI003ABE6CDD